MGPDMPNTMLMVIRYLPLIMKNDYNRLYMLFCLPVYFFRNNV